MKNTEELMKKLYEELKNHFEPQKTVQEVKPKRWKPDYSEKYGYVDTLRMFDAAIWVDDRADNLRYDTGNCYPLDQEERAIWEQVTRRKYDQALRDAADWVDDEKAYHGCWNYQLNRVSYIYTWTNDLKINLPSFQTGQSCIETHTRILGADAKRYFTGEV